MASKALKGTYYTHTPKHSKTLLLAVLMLLCSSLFGQVEEISAINITTATPAFSSYFQTAPDDAGTGVTAGFNYQVFNGVDATGAVGSGSNDVVTSYTINSITFDSFVKPDTFALKRTDGSNFVNIWYEMADDGATYELVPEATSDADAIYLLDALNAGYDNILVNDDDLAGNTIQAQIERVDVIWYNGIVTSSPANAVFSIVERGGNDNIKIAAILSLDGNDEPDSYSSMITINSSDWPGSGQSYADFLILRRQAIGDDPLPLLELGGQTVQGVAIPFDDLGIAANQVVYGYSIFASDVDDTAPGIDLTDIFTFPTTTLSSVSGLDLIASTSAGVSSDGNLVRASGPGGYKAALATWLKANETADVTTSTDGSPVSDWQDHWLGDNDFTTGDASPTYIDDNSGTGIQNINFNQSVDFTGNTSLTTGNNTDFNTGGPYERKSINLTFRTDITDVSNRQVLYEQGGGGRGLVLYIESSSIHLSAWNRNAGDGGGVGTPWNTGTISTISATVDTNTEYIVTMELDGNSSVTGSLNGYLNGESFGSLANVGLLYNHTGGIELGASDGSRYPSGDNNGNNYFEGEISEMVYCNEPATFPLAQRNRIESYLALKYGITLDQNPSQQNYVNANGDIIFNTNLGTALGGFEDYDFDIAGIARDDKSEFEQLKSRSENQNSVVTIERATSFPEDETFLIWGNDNGSNDETNSDLPPLISERTTRVWRVAETGDVGNVSVSFDISELAFTLTGSTPAETDFSLLVANSASNGTMAGATVITGGTLSGNTLTFNNVDFSSGDFFTIGTGFISCSPGGVEIDLQVWLRANLGTDTNINGNPVASWSDQANSNNATSGNAPDYNSNKFNFNPSLDFTAGNSDYMTIPDNTGLNSDQQALFVVGSFSNAGSAFAPFIVKSDDWNISEGWGFVRSGGGDEEMIYSKDGDFGASNFMTYDVPSLNIGYTDASNYNHSLDLAASSSSAKTTLATSSNLVYIGADSGSDGLTPSDFLEGSVSEIVVYDDDLTAVQRQRVASYLAIKYGISIDQTSPQDYLNSNGDIVWNSGTNSGYKNDIAGIGRDDDSCLSQKQSSSINSGTIVTIGNGTIETDNETNPNSFTVDDSFLIWGNDATATTSQDTDVPTGVADRITRVWRVQETGTVGNTSISFDLTGLGYGTNASNFKLIISSSATMSTGITYSGGTFNSDVITFNNIDFSDGDYFTLGVTNSITCGPGGVFTDLDYWLRADIGTGTTTDGTALGTWTDQSTSNRTASEETLGGLVPVEPIYQTEQFNFNPAIEIADPNSSNSVYMASGAPRNGAKNDLSMIAVFSTGLAGGSTTNFEAAPTIISNGSSSTTQDYGMGISEGRVHMNASNNTSLNARSPVGTLYNDFEPYILSGTRQINGAIELYVNGSNVDSGTSTNTSLDGNESASRYGVGNHDDDNLASQFQGFIAEVIVYENDLLPADRNKVESYLAIKYGITKSNNGLNYLSSQNTPIWDYTEDTDYNNDIAGIGRDDNSCLTQLKSKSENDDALVTMEINSLANDDSWLVWANDDVQIEGTTADGNTEFNDSQVSSRLFREWRVQENGTVGEVTITYDLSSLTGPNGIGSNNLNQIRLMVDADGNFTSGTTLVAPSSVDAVNKTVSFTYDFADTDYYTLGSLEVAALPITLISFEAQQLEGKQVLVSWETAEESNNSFFTVERSNDGEEFEVLGRLDGAGNSSALLSYEFLDQEPLNGFSFYRLKQTDFSGDYTYSEIKAVNIEPANLKNFELNKNPISRGEPILIDYYLDNPRKLEIALVDLTGRVWQRKSIEKSSTKYGQIRLDSNSLPRGLNVVKIRDDQGQEFSIKVIIY